MDQGCRMHIKLWGVRGSIPTPQQGFLEFGGNTTCIEVRLPDNQVVIIDGGTGMRNLGKALMDEFQARPMSLRLLMTHFHSDHIQGIPFFRPLYDAANQVTFFSDRPAQELREILEGQMTHPYFPVRFEHLAAERHFEQVQPGTRFGELSVRGFPLNHPQGACGYRLEINGAALVHASDLEHGDPEFERILIEHARDADLLIYDAQYTPEEYASKTGWGHSTWMEAIRTAREANVKKLVLFHHDPEHDDQFMKDLEKEVRRHFENAEVAREGSTLRI
jgi:phosphoribosyl 1,2-cyclic phosphodiesterase